MWLLNAIARRLEYFNTEDEVPNGYAILSHTWGNGEVTFDEIHSPEAAQQTGYQKIEYSCNQALEDGFTYVWIDTCCIDKKSSAELSEAINSMFRWYAAAKVCYAYLSDITTAIDPIQGSRWFTRGWTLQELIAPEVVYFYSGNWNFLGEKTAIVKSLHQFTRISEDVLSNRANLPLKSVAQRMSWAAGRKTTRVEDRAYSLLGIFDVSLPLLYGEGRKAFERLQEEIIRSATTVDHSILAWKPMPTELAGIFTRVAPLSQVLAPSPDGFRYSHNIVSWGLPQLETFELSPRGLRLTGDIVNEQPNRSSFGIDLPAADYRFLALNCRYQDRPSTRLALPLLKRERIEECDPEGRYDITELEEAQYDRSWQSETMTDHLKSIDVFSVRGANRSRTTVTLARYRFFYPHYCGKVHVVLHPRMRSTRIENEPDSMLHVSAKPYLHGSIPDLTKSPLQGPVEDFQGMMDIKVFRAGTTRAANVFISVEGDVIRDQPPELRLLIGWGCPKLLFRTGETQFFSPNNALGLELAISAHYVNRAGELLWSIKIEPTVSDTT